VMAGFAAYVLARVLNLQPVASCACGIVYSCCGYTLSLVNLMNWLLAFPHVAIVVLFWHLFLLERHRRWLALAVIACSFQFLAGAPELTLLTFFLLLGWSLFFPYDSPKLKRVYLWLLLAFFAAGLTAIQSIPTLEMIRLSSRASGSNYFVFSGWSLNPYRLPELIVPNFLGVTTQLSQHYYWGQNIEDLHFPYIVNIYFGFVPIFLALSASLK